MARTRLIGDLAGGDGSGRSVAQIGRISAADAVRAAVAEQPRLTTHDRAVITLLADHGVLTGDQLARLIGARPSTTRHRLIALVRRGVLARFRRHVARGSQSWRYTLGPVGATLHAAATGQTPPTPTRVAERALAFAESPRLDHHLDVAELVAALAHHAHTTPRCALAQWWPERRATAECGGLARPDAAVVWAERGRRMAVWIEIDRGTEPLRRVVGKLDGYRQLAALGVFRPVLIVLPGTLRERHLHTALAGPARGLVVATTARDHVAATGLGPADAVWQPVGDARRVRLIDLAPPGPPPGPPPEPPSPSPRWFGRAS